MPQLTRLLALLLLAAGLAATPALAAHSPFGVGLMEPAVSGPLAILIVWQSQFTLAMNRLMHEIAAGSWLGAATLIGLSFLYGIMHAAGPGHGKAVISSYVMSNRQSVRRGIFLSFVSAIVQAITAIVLVAILAFLFHVTAVTMTDAAHTVELAAFAMVVCLGLYLVATKIARPLWRWSRGGGSDAAEPPACCNFHRLQGLAPPPDAAPATTGTSRFRAEACDTPTATGTSRFRTEACDTPTATGISRFRAEACDTPTATGTSRFRAEACDTPTATGTSRFRTEACDTPQTMATNSSWKGAAASVFSVGLRPCSGALIVLVFSISLKIFWIGVISVLAMSLGTAITVAVLAAIAIGARSVAERMSRHDDRRLLLVVHVFEGIAALIVLVSGVMLFSWSLT